MHGTPPRNARNEGGLNTQVLQQLAKKRSYQEMVDGGHCTLLQLPKVKQALDILQFNGPPAQAATGVKGIWIVGPPNSGKSHMARRIASELYDEEPFTLNCTGGKVWFDGYNQ